MLPLSLTWNARGLSLHFEPFGVMLALGLALGVWMSFRLARYAGRDRAVGAGVLLGALIGAIVGARVVYAIGSPQRESLAVLLAVGRGGLSGYGGLFGAAIGAWASLRIGGRPSRFGADWAQWFDLATPGVLLAIVLGRLGCYLEGCDFGVHLSSNAPRWLARLGSFPRPAADLMQTLPVHPTQLYEAVCLLPVAGWTLIRRSSQRFHGETFLIATLAYAVLRFVTEHFRGDPDRGVFHLLTLTQVCALVSAVLAAVIARRLHNARNLELPDPP